MKINLDKWQWFILQEDWGGYKILCDEDVWVILSGNDYDNVYITFAESIAWHCGWAV